MGDPRAQVELSTTESRIKFLTRTVYDLLQTPASKNKWYEEDERCNLCNERGTLNHILVGCKTTLSQGRYTWRHNKLDQVAFAAGWKFRHLGAGLLTTAQLPKRCNKN